MAIRRPRTVRLSTFLAALSSSVIALLVTASPSLAQSRPGDPTRWGVKVSFVKSWSLSEQVKDLLGGDDEGSVVTMKGSEFEIGFVRASRLGGDWGVSFVRKPFNDGPLEVKTTQDCFNQAQTICQPRTEVNTTQKVILTGIEVHWFLRFVNIKERVQIGLNVGGGITQPAGQVVKTTDSFEPTGFNQNGPTGYRPVHEVETNEAKDELFPFFPQIKLEAVGSVILAPKFKIQVAHGLNVPAISPRIMAVVFF